jgi:hypothetical protein
MKANYIIFGAARAKANLLEFAESRQKSTKLNLRINESRAKLALSFAE